MSAAVETDYGRFSWRSLLRLQIYLWLVIAVAVATLIAPDRDGENAFLNESNLLELLRLASVNGIIAIGLTLVVLTGNIDLSVGAVLALCSVGIATLMIEEGYGLWQTIALVLLLGTFVGYCNGFITAKIGLESVVTTLAVLFVARSVASLWSDGGEIQVTFGEGEGQAPQEFRDLFAGQVDVLGQNIPVPVFYLISVWLVSLVLLYKTRFGRHVVATGGNDTAARLAGIAVDRVRIAVFAIAGFLVGLAALLHTGIVERGSPAEGSGFELNAIAAVVIGGTRLSGGVGGVTGTVIGVLILQVLDNILELRDVQSEYQAIFKGAIIVVAVILHRLRR
jgi:ribose transport system permease protein